MENPMVVRASAEAVPYQTTLSDGQHQWLTDVSVASGGSDNAPSPHQLFLSSLAGCTAITLAMYAKRKQWPLTHIQVDVEVLDEKLNSLPAQLKMKRIIHLQGGLDDSQRQRLHEIANACPIHKLMTGQVQIETQLTVI